MSETSPGNPIIDPLLIIEVPSVESFKLESGAWQEPFFHAEECKSKLLVGSIADYASLPESVRAEGEKKAENRRVRFYTGGEAYAQLLRMTCGMLDERKGETQVLEDLRKTWGSFIEDRPDRVERFGKVMSQIFTDNSTVRHAVFQDHQNGSTLRPVSSDPAVTIKNMLNLRSDDTIMIIADKPDTTINTIKALDNRHRTFVITCADNTKLSTIRQELGELQTDKKIKAELTYAPYREALHNFGHAQAVVSCQPTDGKVADHDLLLNWALHAPVGAKIVHLRGNPQERNAPTAEWKEMGGDDALFPEHIQRQKEHDILHNKKQIAIAETVVTNCTASRLRGTQPVKAHILKAPEEYREFINRVPSRFKRMEGNHAGREGVRPEDFTGRVETPPQHSGAAEL